MKIIKLATIIIAASIGSMAFAAELPIKPDAKLTPGDTFITATKDMVCVPGYTATVRDVPDSLKKKVFAAYKIDPKSDKFEVDHLISLELGGSNDIKNLWPQSYTTLPWNAHVKDKLENRLHAMVCKGQITLADAQKAIATDWVAAYQKYIGK
jgi:hypothetical protein